MIRIIASISILLSILLFIKIFHYPQKKISPNQSIKEHTINKPSSNTNDSEINEAKIQAQIDKNLDLLKVRNEDMALGNRDAKLTIIEYSSLTCPHCAQYHITVFDQIKKEYIDKNHVLYIHRPLPLDAQSFYAASISKCVSRSNSEIYFRLLKMLYKSQLSWVFGDYKKKIGAILQFNGISNDIIKKCELDDSFSRYIAKEAFETKKLLGIVYTPAIIVNGQILGTTISFDEIKKKLENKNIKKIENK